MDQTGPIIKLPIGIDIYMIDMDDWFNKILDLKSFLSSEELSKAEKFHFEIDRDRYIISHGILRKFIGKRLGEPPEKIEYQLNDFGKPRELRDRVQFNMSRSENILLIAIGVGVEIGVDVEKAREGVDSSLISQNYFTSAENNSLDGLDSLQRHHQFFQYWTRKEAFIKAVGMGMSLPLKWVDVRGDFTEDWQKVEFLGSDQIQKKTWFRRDLNLREDVVSTIVVDTIFIR